MKGDVFMNDRSIQISPISLLTFYTQLLCSAFLVLSMMIVTPLYARENGQSNSVDSILDQVRSHSFHPLNEENSFTLDRHLNKHGIANLDNTDWKVRLLAIRDLVRAGDSAVSDIVRGLDDKNQHVRQVSAAALGIMRAESAIEDLERLAQDDSSTLVRSQAVMSLGQIESEGSLPLLRTLKNEDSSRDVPHQCELAIDQIEKKMGASDALRKAYKSLNPETFELLKVGEQALDFTLPDTGGKEWKLSQFEDEKWVVLIWIFADWCPVCHGEFRELIEMKDEFQENDVQVFTLECHDRYRGRVMVGKEFAPDYWFSDKPFKEVYTEKIWWPHLLDRAGAVGAQYGVDPKAFAVHSEYINRPSTVIVDPTGVVRFAYYGTYWGDRPSIHQTLEMIKKEEFDFVHPKRLQAQEY